MITPFSINKILETSLYVENLDEVKDFYENIMNFQLRKYEPNKYAFFRFGDHILQIFDINWMKSKNSPLKHGYEGQSHICFTVPEKEISIWKRYLQGKNVEIIGDIENHNGGRSLYFRDPAGNLIEITNPETWDIPELFVF